MWDVDAKGKIATTVSTTSTVGTKITTNLISCSYAGSSLQGEIPKALLAKLPKGDAVLTILELSASTVPAGDYDVTL